MFAISLGSFVILMISDRTLGDFGDSGNDFW